MKVPPFKIDSYIKNIDQEKIAGCLVFGPESSLVNYRCDLITKKITPDLSDPFLVSDINKERLSESKAILGDEFYSFSMMGGRKLITVKNLDALVTQSLKALFEDSDYAAKSENFILISAGNLDKSSALRKICETNPHFAAIACYEDNEAVIRKFIGDELDKKEIKFTEEVIDLLLEKFGKDRQIILSELNKILIFLKDDKSLKPELVNNLIASESEISANEFIENFASKKYDQAFLNLEKLFRFSFDSIMLIRMLSNYFGKLYSAKAQIASGKFTFEEAVKNQRLFFKVENQFKEHLQKSSLKFLEKNLQVMQELELKMKSSQMPAKLLITNFVQKFFQKN